jgi:hypothetical protein
VPRPDATDPDPTDPVLAALDELVTVLRETSELNRTAILRANAIRRLRGRGHRYMEIVPKERRPLIVELLTQSLYELADASSQFRKVEARALYSEGLTMAEIADLFGVTRQRIAALLRPQLLLVMPMLAAFRLIGDLGAAVT